jgi:Right handed beta helix region/PKD domain
MTIRLIKLTSVAAGMVLSFLSTVHSKDVEIENSQQLLSALDSAGGGDVLMLRPGNYGKLTLKGVLGSQYSFSSPVVLKSIDPSHPAIFSHIGLTNVKNMTFSNIKVDYVYTKGEARQTKALEARNCESISVFSSDFDGDNATNDDATANGFATGIAISFLNSRNIEISNSKIHTWLRGAVFGSVENLKFLKNDIRDMRSDGTDFADVQNVLIEGNSIYAFRRSLESGDHPDMIQFWTTNTTRPSTDITIKNNFLSAEPHQETQSIFMRNEVVDRGLAGQEMYYRNILVEGNVIRNAHIHGITVGASDGLIVKSNTLLQLLTIKEGKKISAPSINISAQSLNVKVIDNITPRVSQSVQDPHAGWIVQSNYFAQRDEKQSDTYYGDVFTNAESQSSVTLADLRVLPDSEPARLGLGSPLSKFDTKPKMLDGFVRSKLVNVQKQLWHFDAKNIFDSSGQLDPKNALFTWDFGDGSQGSGVEVDHAYTRADYFKVTVATQFEDGRILKLKKTISVGRD